MPYFSITSLRLKTVFLESSNFLTIFSHLDVFYTSWLKRMIIFGQNCWKNCLFGAKILWRKARKLCLSSFFGGPWKTWVLSTFHLGQFKSWKRVQFQHFSDGIFYLWPHRKLVWGQIIRLLCSVTQKTSTHTVDKIISNFTHFTGISQCWKIELQLGKSHKNG